MEDNSKDESHHCALLRHVYLTEKSLKSLGTWSQSELDFEVTFTTFARVSSEILITFLSVSFLIVKRKIEPGDQCRNRLAENVASDGLPQTGPSASAECHG